MHSPLLLPTLAFITHTHTVNGHRTMIVFSFCLYGSADKYVLGMRANVEMIAEAFPEAKVWIYLGDVGAVVDLGWFRAQKNVVIIPTGETGAVNCMCRWFPLMDKSVTACFVRDADSRVTARDAWCIRQFLAAEESKCFHCVRDNRWHRNHIMAGMSGWNRAGKGFPAHIDFRAEWKRFRVNNIVTYGSDEVFLNRVVSPWFPNDTTMVHTNLSARLGEVPFPIDVEQKDDFDFVGNVYDGKDMGPMFRYSEWKTAHYHAHLAWLQEQQQFDILTKIAPEFVQTRPVPVVVVPVVAPEALVARVEQAVTEASSSSSSSGVDKDTKDMVATAVTPKVLEGVPPEHRCGVLHQAFQQAIQMANFEAACAVMEAYHFGDVTDQVVAHSNQLLRGLQNSKGVRLIATTDVDREAQDGEIVILYGNFALWVASLPCATNKTVLKRNIKHYFLDKADLIYDAIESDPCWSLVKCIHILGLKSREDRFLATCEELAQMHAPLDRIVRYEGAPAAKGGENAYSLATWNHCETLSVMEKSLTAEQPYGLILEDDFTFSDMRKDIKRQMNLFFQRKYHFNVCFLAVSKHHHKEPFDDLLMRSLQICTTSSAYFVHKDTVGTVAACVREGYDYGKTTGDYHNGCCDRYMCSKLPLLFYFKFKWGFQRASWSNLTNNVTNYLD
jgi:hypothetical protein